jgi:hypothetical protein
VVAVGLDELRERRDEALRLRPELALASLDEAEAFVRERRIVTLTPSCSLPSLYGACHEEPYTRGGKGFGAYPKTKWPWGWELRERPGIYWLRLLRGTGVFLVEEVAAAADPLCSEELTRAEAGAHGETEARLVAHLAAAGPSLLDEVKEEMGLSPKALRKARTTLERFGVVVAREVVLGRAGRHRHTSELRRWDQLEARPTPASRRGSGSEKLGTVPPGRPERTRRVSRMCVDSSTGTVAAGGTLGALLIAGVRAAVVAPEREAQRWFSWPAPPELVDELVARGRLVRPEPGWLAEP